jgi:hypothetical protein
MYKTLLAVVLLAVPAFAQNFISSSAASYSGAAAGQDYTAAPGAEPAVPRGSLTASYVYQFVDSQNGNNRSLMGWSAVPEFNFTRHIGLQADFAHSVCAVCIRA